MPLCFAKHSGFGGYDYTQWNHGVRVFDVHQANLDAAGVQTHIRFLTGEEVSASCVRLTVLLLFSAHC